MNPKSMPTSQGLADARSTSEKADYVGPTVRVPADLLAFAVGMFDAYLGAAQEGKFWRPASHVGIRTREVADDLRALLDKSGAYIDYDGPDPSVECAHDGCQRRLRRSDHGGPQWCSEDHRRRDLRG